MCTCHSYNADIGTTPEVILDPNEFFDWDVKAGTVCVDACIAREIRELWFAGIWTRGCCCGHNGKFGNPNVILDSSEDPQKAIELLQKIDPDRSWDILQWKLTKCN